GWQHHRVRRAKVKGYSPRRAAPAWTRVKQPRNLGRFLSMPLSRSHGIRELARGVVAPRNNSRSALPRTLNAQTRMMPTVRRSVASESTARNAVGRSPYAAGHANAIGNSGETTPGTTNPAQRIESCARGGWAEGRPLAVGCQAPARCTGA